MKASDPFDLERFVEAQTDTYRDVLRELRSGQKRSHWMWFIFPQIDGLGSSPTAKRYAIRGLDEARAYLAHPVLGPRLRECTSIVNALQGRSALEVFGKPDNRKFRSSMTLFELVDEPGSVFATALGNYFAGERDSGTLGLVGLGRES